MATLPPLDALILKGTHNSYDPRRRVPPWDQVNDYGVWVLELDYMVPAEFLRQAHDRDLPEPVWNTRPPAVVIGHDGPGDAADGAGAVFGGPHFLLRDYLSALAVTEAFRFRPLLIYLDRKNPVAFSPFGVPVELFDRTFHEDPQRLASVIESTFKDVFHEDHLFGPAALAARRGYPTVQELAGQVIPISNQPEPASEFLFHEGDPADERQSRLSVGPESDGCGEPDFISRSTEDAPAAVYRLDNFSDNFTFAYAVPSNPLVVVPAAGEREVVGCDDETTATLPQGTRLLPFPTLEAAVSRARGLPGGQDPTRLRRAGLGFTVLAAPGPYGEPLTVDFPLTIRGG